MRACAGRGVLLPGATFLWVGMATTVLGPIVPALIRDGRLDAAQAGLLFAAQFLGSLVSAAASTACARRAGSVRVLAAGYACVSLGVAGLGALAWPSLLGASVLNGIGLGLSIPLTNLLVARAAGPRSSAHLTVLNLVWGIGAVTWPLIVALGSRRADGALAAPTLFLACGIGASALAALPLVTSDRVSLPPAGGAAWSGSVFRALMMHGVLQLLYVGTETAIGGWAGEHVRRIDSDAHTWMLAPTMFWAALMVGRVAGVAVLRGASDPMVIAGCLTLVLIASIFLVLTPRADTMFLVIAAAGLGCSLVFPILTAVMAADLDRRAPALAGIVFACGGLGGALLPWVVGLVASRAGSLRAGLIVPALACAAMLAILPAWARAQRTSAPADALRTLRS